MKELLDEFDYVGIFAVNQGWVAFDDGDVGSEAAHGLGELETDEAAAEDEEVFGEGGEFEDFDVSEGGRFGEARDGVDGGAGASVEEDVVRAQGARTTSVEGDFDGLVGDEATKAHDDLGVGLCVIGEMHVAEAVDHALTTGADGLHVNVPFAVDDAELCAALEEGSDLCRVNDVFTRQAGDVGAGSADAFVFDVCYLLALGTKVPGEVLSAFSAAYNDCVVLFWGGH